MYAYKTEKAKREIRSKIYEIRIKQGISAGTMEGILSSILLEIKEEAVDEIVKECDVTIRGIADELEKAKAAAKKVLKAEPGQVSESDTG